MLVLYLLTVHTYIRTYVQMEVHVKQVEVKVEGESARPLIALIASASGFVSNWSTEVCVSTGMGGHCIISYMSRCKCVFLCVCDLSYY